MIGIKIEANKVKNIKFVIIHSMWISFSDLGSSLLDRWEFQSFLRRSDSLALRFFVAVLAFKLFFSWILQVNFVLQTVNHLILDRHCFGWRTWSNSLWSDTFVAVLRYLLLRFFLHFLRLTKFLGLFQRCPLKFLVVADVEFGYGQNKLVDWLFH